MATTTLTHPEHTAEIVLATTAGRIVVEAGAAARMQAVYLYSTSEFRIARSASPVADGGTAPSSNYAVIPGSTMVPIGLAPRNSGDDTVINVWATAGTPTVHILPYPVAR